MRIKTKKSEILEPLQKINLFIPTSSTLSILSSILFSTEENFLYLQATDMDINAKIKCHVSEIKEQGKVVIPKKIVSLIKELPDADIHIESDENNVIKINCLKTSFKITGENADEFPPLAIEEKKLDSIKIKQKLLKEAIKHTAFSALKDSSKRNFNGVFLKFESNNIEVVATDAHRLSLYKVKLKDSVKTSFEYIIPLKTINELSKILEEDEEKELEINFYKNLIEFKFENIEIITRIIDESFPDYNQVIPKDAKMIATINREELLNSIKRALTLTSEKSTIVMFKFEKNKLYLSTQAGEEGEFLDEIDIEYDSEEIEIFYNASYLLDVLKVLEAEKIEIKLVSSMNPCIIKSKESDDYIYIVMPIRK